MVMVANVYDGVFENKCSAEKKGSGPKARESARNGNNDLGAEAKTTLKNPPGVVIVGAGLRGLTVARTQYLQLRVALIDHTNHRSFQPLLCQLATPVVAPGNKTRP
jgi:hypothetical protein